MVYFYNNLKFLSTNKIEFRKIDKSKINILIRLYHITNF